MISAVVITKNEQDKISACLDSLKWVDEIIVVDDYSDDETVNICKGYTDKVLQNRFQSFSAQKQFAFSKATGEWILSVDADEVVPEALRQEIAEVLSQPGITEKGYHIPRKTFFLNKWIRHCGWYPGYQLRLFKNGSWQMKDVRVHEAVSVEGETAHLKEALLHYSYPSISVYIDRMNKYTTLAAKQAIEEGLKINTKRPRRTAFGKTLKTFYKMYIKQGGFKDGIHGFFLCVFSAVYQLMVYAKYWQIRQEEIT